jgi:hypothetical protein
VTFGEKVLNLGKAQYLHSESKEQFLKQNTVLTVPTSTYIGMIKRSRRKKNNWDVETYRIKLKKRFDEFVIASVQGLQNKTYLLKLVIFESKNISKFGIFSKLVRFKLHKFSNF